MAIYCVVQTNEELIGQIRFAIPECKLAISRMKYTRTPHS